MDPLIVLLVIAGVAGLVLAIRGGRKPPTD